MALKGICFVLFVGFLGFANACVWNSDCGYWETCCSDAICRSDCDAITGEGIAGIVVGSVIFIAIVVSIFSCCFCACCPYYRYRYPGTVVVTQPGYQQFVNTTTCTSQQTVPHPPPTGAYGQPPPYYPQPQAAAYPPPQAQGQAPHGGKPI